MAQRPLVCTFSAYSSTVPSGKLNLFWTTLVSSLILRPFSPSTFCVRVAMMMISVLVGVTRTWAGQVKDGWGKLVMTVDQVFTVEIREGCVGSRVEHKWNKCDMGQQTSTPEYPSSASSLVRNSFSSALKTPSATNFLFLET